MQNKNVKFYITRLIALSVLVLALFLILSVSKPQETKELQNPITTEPEQNIDSETQSEQTPLQPASIEVEKPETQTLETVESITVMTGEMAINLPLESGASFYDVLLQAKENGKIEFAGKNYPGLGFFITDIGTLHAGSGKYLLYYVNGKEATVGISSYVLKNGDIIEWKLE